MTISEDTLVDYVMGALSKAEEREVAVYLNDHPDEALVVRDFFEVMTLLVLEREPAELPDNVERILLERVRQEEPDREGVSS